MHPDTGAAPPPRRRASATSTRCSRPRRPSSPPRASTPPRRRSPTWPASESARCTGTSRSARTWSKPCSSARSTPCADAGPALAAAHEPAEALAQLAPPLHRVLATKRGLASALHSGDPAFAGLPGYFLQRLGPALAALLDAAAAERHGPRRHQRRRTCSHAVALLCQPAPDTGPSTANGWSPCSSTACAATPTRRARDHAGCGQAGWSSRAGSKGNVESSSCPSSVMSSCCSSLTPSWPPSSPM